MIRFTPAKHVDYLGYDGSMMFPLCDAAWGGGGPRYTLKKYDDLATAKEFGNRITNQRTRLVISPTRDFYWLAYIK